MRSPRAAPPASLLAPSARRLGNALWPARAAAAQLPPHSAHADWPSPPPGTRPSPDPPLLARCGEAVLIAGGW
eukprot:3579207-Alexandrium_andersonii.AAC.1